MFGIFFSLEIAKHQRREVRPWKSSKLQTLLQHAGNWKRLWQLQNVAKQRTTEEPRPDDFADMLDEIFSGNPGAPTQPERLDEPLWTREELRIKVCNHASSKQQGS